MSYTKTTWASGDRITANKLNNIEGGVESANSPFFDINVSLDGTTVVVDKTYSEIEAAYNSNKILRCVTHRSTKAGEDGLGVYFIPLNCTDVASNSSGFLFKNFVVSNTLQSKKVTVTTIAIYNDDTTMWFDSTITIA